MAHGAEPTAIPASDPLLAHQDLPFDRLFFPFGFPVRIQTNSEAVVAAAERNWAGLKLRFDEAEVLLRVIVSGQGGSTAPPPPTYRAQRRLLMLSAGAANFGCCDLAQGFGAAWITMAVASDIEYLRYCFLEGMATSMLEALHLVSVHAACVELQGRGVLLCGDSGAGKTSLAFACARRGWTYVTDDCASLVRGRPGRAVIGACHSIRFRDNAGKLFPEIAGRATTLHARHKPTIEIRTSDFSGLRTAPECEAHFIVFLDRHARYGKAAELAPKPSEEVRGRLYPGVWPAELDHTREQVQALDRLLEVPVFELRYRDLDPAVSRLEALVREGA